MKELNIDIKYFNNAKELTINPNGNWIDVYANEDVTLRAFDHALIPLGFAMKLPEGYEAYLAPRSSTYKNWGIIIANSIGIIDTSYCGDEDEWKLSVICLNPKECVNAERVSRIYKGDKIAQFRIIESMPIVKFNPVESLEGKSRGGFGTTGKV